MEQGHHGHRHRTADGAIRGFHGDGEWAEGTCEEPDEVWVFCGYTGKLCDELVDTVHVYRVIFLDDLIFTFILRLLLNRK